MTIYDKIPGSSYVTTVVVMAGTMGITAYCLLSTFVSDIQGVCDPVHVTIYSRDEVQISLQDFNFFDVGPINSTDIFNAPKKCLK